MIRVGIPGLHATIQDGGRTAYQRVGVPTAGAADRAAHAAANALVGNDVHEAAIEVVGLPFTFVAERSLLVAATGRSVRLVARDEIPGWTCAFVRAGDEVRVEGRSRYAYIAVAGGVDVPVVLGSRSAYPAARLGPAPLGAGTRIRVREARLDLSRAGRNATPPGYEAQDVRVVLGPHDEGVDVETFLAARFAVDERSDRMGVRLAGPPIEVRGGERLSAGMVEGAIQVPPGGGPIVLLADHQTTGGYAAVATVIAADLPVVAQREPGEPLHFVAENVRVAVAERQRMRRELERVLALESD